MHFINTDRFCKFRHDANKLGTRPAVPEAAEPEESAIFSFIFHSNLPVAAPRINACRY